LGKRSFHKAIEEGSARGLSSATIAPMSKIFDKIAMMNLLAVIRDDHPLFEIRSVKRMTDGLDNIVMEINDEYIFRFPRLGWISRVDERAVLEMFRGKTHAEVPNVLFFGRRLKYIGYPKIQGVTLSEEESTRIPPAERKTLSTQLGRFLLELHGATEIEMARSAGVAEYDTSSFLRIHPVIAAAFPDDKPLLDFAEKAAQEFEQMPADPALRRVLHWDLHNGNIILAPTNYSLNGVVDFDTVTICDLHAEFRSLYRFSPLLAKETMEIYSELIGVPLSFQRVKLYAWLVKLVDLADSADRPWSGTHINAKRRLQKWMRDELVQTQQSELVSRTT
jgi:hypothetical protein